MTRLDAAVARRMHTDPLVPHRWKPTHRLRVANHGITVDVMVVHVPRQGEHRAVDSAYTRESWALCGEPIACRFADDFGDPDAPWQLFEFCSCHVRMEVLE